ncbi:MAG: hypothetical protein ABJZ55_02230 [Fuerstiella sp.]
MNNATATIKIGLVSTSDRLIFILALITCLLSSGSSSALLADELAWHDHQFMQMLSRSQLDHLARIHATRQRDQAKDADLKARWQQTLATLARTEMWFASEEDRSEILQHNLKDSLSIHDITDPMLSFYLSIETGRMIQAESEAALVTAESANLYGKKPVPIVTTVQKRFKQLEAEIEKLETMGRRFSGQARSLSSQQKAKARDEIRNLTASLKCQQIYWLAIAKPSTVSQSLRLLNAEIESMTRSTRSATSKMRLQILQADLAARYSSPDDYRLMLTPLLAEDAQVRPSTLAAIRIRFWLRQREVSTAEKNLSISTPLTHLEKQKLLWLATEICVGQSEQASRLDDRKMISSAQNRLNQLTSVIAKSETGTYIRAARRCLQKAELILQLGSELAESIEQVNRSRQQGDNQLALQQISIALQRLPANESQTAKAALLLIATQLNIDQQLWNDAIETGRSAVIEFQHNSLPEKAAAADLLKCFAMAQISQNGPNERADYLAALQTHIQTFSAAPTSAIAVKWALQLTAVSAPETAMQVIIDRLQQTKDQPERDQLVTQANTIFWQELTSSDIKSSQRISIWQRSIQDAAAKEFALQIANGNQTLIAVQLVSAPATVQQVTSWLQRLTQFADKKRAVQQDLQHRLLHFTLNAKLSTDVAALKQQRLKILMSTADEQQQSLYFLTRALDQSRSLDTIQLGDAFLARTVDQLAINLLTSQKPNGSVAIKLLPILSNTAQITGDQEAIQQVMAALSPDQIKGEKLQQLVTSLSLLTKQTGNKPVSITPELKSMLMVFWKQLITSQPAGSDLWLEGLVQVGTLSSSTSEMGQLKRQFEMANILYPKWGNAGRKLRAITILGRLKSVKPKR